MMKKEKTEKKKLMLQNKGKNIPSRRPGLVLASNILLTYLEILSRGQSIGAALKALDAPAEDLDSIPCTTWRFTTICDSNVKGFDTLF